MAAYAAYGVMFDSATGAYPPGAALCAYYVNGRYARPAQYGRGKVWIDVIGNAPRAALWLDVETGDATPADVPGWLDERRSAGLGAGGVYCSRAALPAIEQAAAGRPHLLWVATLDGDTTPALPPVTGQLVAVQAFPASMLGFDADMSVVVDPGWWEDRALA
jgi:hypothetical protein